ncbi:MAG TPA: PorP/SprF family type IX secretion system membrane protein [Bacteroidales bacterium]|nr:PorP/SprF family type IX secretion system membrane protein [Bacteroidales bacterium]
MQTLKNILFAALLICSGSVYSQDIHFSQFYNVPMLVNPAHTGSFDGDWQASAGYRNQWKSIAQPFRTLAVSYERQFYIQSHHISGGLFILNDNSGNIALKSNQFVLSGAYHRTINNHRLHGGLQVGYVHKVVDFGDNVFPDQWDPSLGYYNPLLNTGVEDGDKLSYLDVNLGVMWQKKFGKFLPEGGVAVYHINNPKESFYDDDVHLPPKMAFHAGVKCDVTPNVYITPRLLLMNQKGAKDYIFGTSAGFSLPPNSSGVREINGGIYMRNTLANNTDAVVVTVGTMVRNIQLGISYDLNISSLQTYSNNRGAFEITLIYRSISTILNTFTIPCERL